MEGLGGLCLKLRLRLLRLQVADTLGVALPVPGQRRVDQAGDDGVHRDAVLAQVQRRRLHQADDAPLGRRVGRAEPGAMPPLGAAGDDDPPAHPALDDVRRDGADGVGGAGQVHVDLVMPVRILPLQDGLEALDASVGEQDVDAAPRRHRVGRRPPQRRQVALVQRARQPAPARGLDHAAGLRQLVRRCLLDIQRRAHRPGDIDAQHVCPGMGERNRRRPADAAGRPGDDRDLAGQHAAHARPAPGTTGCCGSGRPSSRGWPMLRCDRTSSGGVSFIHWFSDRLA